MSERVEWLVGYRDSEGELQTRGDGAQSVFGLTRAKRLAKDCGDPWQVFHQRSRLPLEEHELIQKSQE